MMKSQLQKGCADLRALDLTVDIALFCFVLFCSLLSYYRVLGLINSRVNCFLKIQLWKLTYHYSTELIPVL